MKYFVILFITLVFSPVAMADTANADIKECLKEYGYSPEKFNTFNFGPAAYCASQKRTDADQKKIAELREFVKNKPWYKGKNWNWEECAKRESCIQNYQYIIK